MVIFHPPTLTGRSRTAAGQGALSDALQRIRGSEVPRRAVSSLAGSMLAVTSMLTCALSELILLSNYCG